MNTEQPAQPDPIQGAVKRRSLPTWVVVVLCFAPIFALFGLLLVATIDKVSDDFRPGYQDYQRGNYAAAETEFRQFTEGSLTCNDPEGHYYLGLSLLHEGKIAEAQEEIQNAYDHPEGGGKNSDPGTYYYRAKRLLKAMKELPAEPTAAQLKQWLAKYPKLISPK